MLYFVFTLLFVAAAYARHHPFAHQRFNANQDMSSKCALALQQMVFPPTTCSMQYLERLSRTLQVQSPLLFTAYAADVLANFASKYGVYVFITDAFGNNYASPPNTPLTAMPPGFSTNGGTYTPTSFPADFSSLAQANVIGQGFMNNNGYTYYTFVIWNHSGEMYYVNVGAATTNSPFC